MTCSTAKKGAHEDRLTSSEIIFTVAKISLVAPPPFIPDTGGT